MMQPYKYQRSASKITPGYMRSSKRLPPAKKKLDDLAKKVNRIYRSIEVSYARQEGLVNLVGTGNGSLDNQIWAVAPTTTNADPKAVVLARGPDEGQRIGNSVSTRKNYFDFCAVLKPWNASTNANPRPLYLTAWVVSIRGGSYATTVVDVEGLITSRFFNSGTSYQGFSDSVLDQIRTVNEDVFTLHAKKTYKLGNASTFASGAGGATPTSAQGYTNNDFSIVVKDRIDLTKFTPRTIRYNDGDILSYNNQKWLFFTMSNCDGSAISLSLPVLS